MKLKDLLEKRTRLVKELRAISENPEGEGDLSEAQALRFDELKGDLERAETAIQRQQVLDEAERRMQGEPLAGRGDDRLDQALSEFSLTRAIASAAGMNVDAGRERELSQELANRSGQKPRGFFCPMEYLRQPVETRTVTAGGDGGYLIETTLHGDKFVDLLRAKPVVASLGARRITGLVGNADLPRLTESTVGYWVGEDASVTTSDPAFGKVSLSPRTVGARTELSRNMLMQSSPDAEQLMRDDLAKILALAVDNASINGTGGVQPIGILSDTDVSVVAMGTDGGTITWAKVLDLLAELETSNAKASAFLSNPQVVKAGRQVLKVDSDAGAGFIINEPNRLAGYPLASSNLVPSNLSKGSSTEVCSALICGDFTDLILAYWGDIDILVNPYAATSYEKGAVQIRAMLSMDMALRHSESFAVIKDLTTA